MQQTADNAPWNVLVPEIMDTDKYLSSANAPDLEEDVRLCIESGARKMILNCAAMTYMTATGIRALLNMARMMKDAGGTFSIQALSGQPRQIFTACGIDALIPSVDAFETETSNITSINAA